MGSKFSRITPLLGEAFLISAITAESPAEIFDCNAAAKPRGTEALFNCAFNCSILTLAFRSATSCSFLANIFFNTVGVSILIVVSLKTQLSA